MAISIFITDGLGEVCPIWVRQTLAASLSIACMVKLGITHPPAGAMAVVFATSRITPNHGEANWRWTHFVMAIVGYLLSIITAMLVNNWSDFRQYPTFWGNAYLQAKQPHVPIPPKESGTNQIQLPPPPQQKSTVFPPKESGTNEFQLPPPPQETPIVRERIEI
jgi:HPP family